jgi:hypothetical protein
MGEWLKPAVLKTVELERVPGVRIPLPPPFIYNDIALDVSRLRWTQTEMPRPERQIWLRHKKSCKHRGKASTRSLKGCDCPVYARVTILNPDTDEVLFRWSDSSLHKLGIRRYEATLP